MNVVELIRRKRDGEALPAAALGAFVGGVTHNLVTDAQLGAFLMAVYLRDLDAREQAALTLAMRDSGAVLEWPRMPGPVLDKHSTGGVGDLVSLVLAPLMAACGAYVPMISGRGLGHTGGTLDKLESIPGLAVDLPLDQVQRGVRKIGLAMVGQGSRLVPADRRLYATRDLTATVSSQPLIVASILSKKFAEGLDGLVMDIKTGNGAIMTDPQAAASLGKAIVDVALEAGLPCSALLTDMNQPLAWSAGNALEMHEALDFLRGGRAHPRLAEVLFALCRELLAISGMEPDVERAQDRLQAALESGAAAERFARMVAFQGGPADLLERPGHYLPEANVVQPVLALDDAYVQAMDTLAIGRLVNALGAGRERAEDAIDPSVGLSSLPSIGDRIESGQALAMIHAASADDASAAEASLRRALQLGEAPPTAQRPVIHGRLSGPAPGSPGPNSSEDQAVSKRS